MSANRKLQGEIDRCLKKVSEGVEKFEETWQKVHNASSGNQKEKYEEDLKKEIKKLQRLRDQIKTWIASSAVNDKSVLMEKRKLIEQQMERFKVVERETKTKAYSKEGLIVGAKLDPAEKERAETSDWLNQCIDTLNVQVDQFEAEIESLGSSSKKKKSRDTADQIEEYTSLLERHRFHVQKLEALLRMLDNETVDIGQIKDIKDSVEYYIENCREPDFLEDDGLYDDIEGLEEMMLDVTNVSTGNNFREKGSTSSADGAPSLQNHRDHGSSNHTTTTTSSSSSSSHNPVDSSEASTNSAGSPVPAASSSSNHHSSRSSAAGGESGDHGVNHNNGGSGGSSTDSKRRHKSASEELKSGSPSLSTSSSIVSNSSKSSGGNNAASAPSSASILNSSSSSSAPKSSAAAVAAAATSSSSSSSNSAPSSAAVISSNNQHFSNSSSSTSNNSSSSSSKFVNANNASPSSGKKSNGGGASNEPAANFAAAVQLNGHAQATSVSNPLSDLASSTATSNGTSSATPPSTPLAFSQVAAARAEAALKNNAATNNNAANISSLKAMAQEAVAATSSSNNNKENNNGQLYQQQLQQQQQSGGVSLSSTAQSSVMTTVSPSASNIMAGLGNGVSQQQPSSTTTAIGEAHIPPLLGVAPLGHVPLNKETRFQYAMLESAFAHMPHPSDSERLRPYLPRNPCPTPAYYPQLPPPGSESLEFFQKLSTETLFFIFYYMEGTQAQFLAAKALKKQSWRFHTKYMMWFQRHEEPKLINDEFEQGTYIYFDFEKWGQRKKEGFMFEYRFLEDRDLN